MTTTTSTTGSARNAILGRIQGALRDVPATEAPDDRPIPRDYRKADAELGHDARIEWFVERVAEYKATVVRVAEAALPAAIAEACAARKIKRLVAPAEIPDGWLPPGVAVLRDPGLSIEQLENSDAVLTTCALGIAQTGTIALDSGPGQGRRVLTLLPDVHLCVIREDQVVGLVPEAIAGLREVAARPITFISGPSATSDIELNRVEGVHGPRTLDVFVVRGA